MQIRTALQQANIRSMSMSKGQRFSSHFQTTFNTRVVPSKNINSFSTAPDGCTIWPLKCLHGIRPARFATSRHLPQTSMESPRTKCKLVSNKLQHKVSLVCHKCLFEVFGRTVNSVRGDSNSLIHALDEGRQAFTTHDMLTMGPLTPTHKNRSQSSNVYSFVETMTVSAGSATFLDKLPSFMANA